MGLGQFIGAFADAAAPAPIVVAPPSWQRRLRRWAIRRAWRAVRRIFIKAMAWGRALAPWYLALTVWLAAAIAGQLEQGWRTLAGLALLGAVPMYWWLGLPLGQKTRRRRRVKPAEQRIWYAAFYALLSVWASVGAAWTVLPPWTGVLWVGTFAVWVRWMWHRRIRKAEPVQVAGVRELTWASVKGLKGTVLENIVDREAPARWEADVDLGDTDLLVKDVMAAAPHVAKRYKVPITNVVVDYSPSRLEHTAKLTVVRDNPLFDPVVYDESWIPTEQDIADGCVPFHMYPNGMRARVRLWLPGAGTVNSMFTGDIRTGKSAGMDTKLLQAVWTGKVWPMAADPQGGVSMPWWCAKNGRGLAMWQAVDEDQIWTQLCAFRDAMYARSEMMSEFEWVDKWGDQQRGINCWDPTIPGMPPAVTWSCDEFWRLMLRDDFFAVFKECLKMQNKTGMLMDIATQYPGIEELHNDMALRQPLTAGNLMAYRNTATSVKEMILPKGLPSPLDIPWETPEGQHTKGTLICASQAPRSSLPVYSRTVWAERGRYWGERAMERVPELDDVTAAVFAKHRLAKPAEPKPTEKTRESITATRPAPAKLRVEDRIMAFLRDHEGQQAHTGVIADALDLPKGTAGTTLKRMAARGTVRQVRRGIWGLPADDRELAGVA